MRKKRSLKPKKEKKGEVIEPKKLTILEQQQKLETVEEKLLLVSTNWAVNSKGYKETWIGGKLHISVVDGDIPITAFY